MTWRSRCDGSSATGSRCSSCSRPGAGALTGKVTYLSLQISVFLYEPLFPITCKLSLIQNGGQLAQSAPRCSRPGLTGILTYHTFEIKLLFLRVTLSNRVVNVSYSKSWPIGSSCSSCSRPGAGAWTSSFNSSILKSRHILGSGADTEYWWGAKDWGNLFKWKINQTLDGK